MAISISDLTVDDFIDSGWETVIARCDRSKGDRYEYVFSMHSIECQRSGDDRHHVLFRLLHNVTSMWLSFDDQHHPFQPQTRMNGMRSAIETDFDEPTLLYLGMILPHVTDPQLCARIADILWLRRPQHQFAEKAIDAYLSVTTQEPMEYIHQIDKSFHRALDLALSINNTDKIKAVTDKADEIIAKATTYENLKQSPLCAEIMQILQEKKYGDYSRYGEFAERQATDIQDSGNLEIARDYFDVAAKWFSLANDKERARQMQILAAESLNTQAEWILKGPSPSHMGAAQWRKQAIARMRQIGGMDDRITELHHLMLADQEKAAILEMHRYTGPPLDITETVNQAIAQVRGKKLEEAFYHLVFGPSLPRIDSLRSQAQENQKISIIKQFMPITRVNSMGRTIASGPRNPSGYTDEDLLNDMDEIAILNYTFIAQALIEPMRRQINTEHRVEGHYFQGLVRFNSFVPMDRQGFFIRGLWAGMIGDFVLASHFLIPQIEHSIRFTLNQHGKITSGLNSAGVQEEYDLNKILVDDELKAVLNAIWSEDMTFALRALLISRYGANLRNDMAHGLLGYESYDSYPCCYLWWLALRMCYIPHVMAAISERDRHGDDSPASTDPDPSEGLVGAETSGSTLASS